MKSEDLGTRADHKTYTGQFTRVQQNQRNLHNPGLLMKKYRGTGVFPQKDPRKAIQGDFSSGIDFAESLRRTQAAEESFLELPAKIRSRFKNNPGELIDFVMNTDNREEAVELGILARPEAPNKPLNDLTEAIKDATEAIGEKVNPESTE